MEEREATTPPPPLVEPYWYWSASSAAQLAGGIHAYKRGKSGNCSMMPLRAFFVSSLLLGSAASAAAASLHASGVHSVEDMKVVGANIRTAIGVSPSVGEKTLVEE